MEQNPEPDAPPGSSQVRGIALDADSTMPESPPGLLPLTWASTIVELKTFFRNPQWSFFTFGLPILLLVLFASIFNGKIQGPPGTQPLPFKQYFIAGMIAAGIMSTTFSSLAISISVQRHEGLVKRLAGTPLPKTAYFGGKIGLAITSSVIQTCLMLAFGMALYGLSLPSDPQRWGVFALVFVLGVSSCSLIGIAYTRLIPSAQSAAAIVQPPFLTLQFISGVFFRFSDIPSVLQAIASVFPLRWMALGFRYVFLPDWLKSQETGQSWQLDRVIIILSIWMIVGLLVAARTFRWAIDEQE
jgi:ABC-2 type transport system permease protein